MGREVDRDAQRRAGLQPHGNLLAGGIKHIVAQGHDLPGSLRHRNKTHGADIPQHRIIPAQQRLHPHHCGTLYPDLRLVMQLQPAVAERHAQALGQLHTLGHFLTHARLEKHGIATTPRLGAVHGHIGKPHQIIASLGIIGIQRDANAGPEIQRQPIMFERDGQRSQNLIAPESRTGGVLPRQEHDEFIASKPRQNAFAAQLRFQASGDFSEQMVASSMPVTVVDSLEIIQIQLQQGHGIIASLSNLELLLQFLTKLPAVVKAGQSVLGGLKLQTLLHLVQLRHIPDKGDSQAFAIFAQKTQSNVDRHCTTLLSLQP